MMVKYSWQWRTQGGGAPMRAPPPLEKSETELIYEDHLSRASYLQPSNKTSKVGYATG